MPDIHIAREHTLGLEKARALAFRWAQTAEAKFDMACSYEEGTAGDRVAFKRSGVHGELRVTPGRFELHARLGFLLGAFKDRIEAEITRNLDELLRQDDPLAAFDAGVAQASAAAQAKADAKAAARKPASPGGRRKA